LILTRAPGYFNLFASLTPFSWEYPKWSRAIAWASKQPEKAAELQLAIVPVVTVLPPTELSNFRPRSGSWPTLVNRGIDELFRLIE
jgi:hypothetical protein